MSDVSLVDGHGLVGRADTTIWWAADGELIDALATLSETGFKGLAAKILELDFAVGALAVVDLEKEVAFVFGDAQLRSGDAVLDGSMTGTWIEQRLTDVENFAVNAYVSTTDNLTNLVEGTVRAGGFVFGKPDLEAAPPEQSGAEAASATSPEIEEQATPSKPEPELANATLIVPSKQDRGDDSAEHIVTADRLADPDVEQLTDEYDHVPDEQEPEPAPGLQGPKVAMVELDDGRKLDVRGGLIVGRNPASSDLPAGFASLTVLGEFVSRRHWELDLDLVAPKLRDLGSSGGTIVEFADGQRRLGPNESVDIEHNFRVLFADHWASVVVKPG